MSHPLRVESSVTGGRDEEGSMDRVGVDHPGRGLRRRRGRLWWRRMPADEGLSLRSLRQRCPRVTQQFEELVDVESASAVGVCEQRISQSAFSFVQ